MRIVWPAEQWGCNAGVCTNPQILTFSGVSGADVGLLGPFNFTGWSYDAPAASVLPMYSQSILNGVAGLLERTSIQVTCRRAEQPDCPQIICCTAYLPS